MIQSVISLVMIVLVPLVLRLGWNAQLSDCKLAHREFRANLGRGLLAWGLVTPICYIVLFLILLIPHMRPSPHMLQVALMRDFSVRTVLVTALKTAGAAAPLSEEMLFRGVLLGWLDRPGRCGEGPDPQLESHTETPLDSPTSPPVLPASRSLARRSMPNVITSFLFAAIHAGQGASPCRFSSWPSLSDICGMHGEPLGAHRPPFWFQWSRDGR